MDYFKPGDLLSERIVWSEEAFEVLRTTPHTMTIRACKPTDRCVQRTKTFEYREIVPDENGAVQTVRRSKHGSFSAMRAQGSLKLATVIDGVPVTYHSLVD